MFQRHEQPTPTGTISSRLGLRNSLAPEYRHAEQIADQFDGLPDGVDHPAKLLAAMKDAAPFLGIPTRLVHLMDWLFRFTQPQDWKADSRPIVWPSSRTMREALSVSDTRTRQLIHDLVTAGLITMRDSPNGNRYGRRDRAGCITEAYGFDLSPMAVRYEEFRQAAAAGKAESKARAALRRRITIARRGIELVIVTAREEGFDGPDCGLDLEALSAAVTEIPRATAGDHHPLAYLEEATAALERHRKAAEAWWNSLLKTNENSEDCAGYTAENCWPEYLQTKTISLEDTVMASEGCSQAGRAVTEPEATVQQAPAIAAEAGKTVSSPYPAAPTAGAHQAAAQEPDERDLRTDPVELLSLFPALVPYIRTLHPDWREFIEAAWWMRGRLGISDRLWREACEVFGSGITGQARAAIAVGIVSSKPLDHFKSGPGGYFFGMVQKAKRGELHLEKTLWGMRKDGQGLGKDLRQILKHHLTC